MMCPNCFEIVKQADELRAKINSLTERVRELEKDRDGWKRCFDKAIQDLAERDVQLERAKKLMRFQWILEEDFDTEWKKTVEEGGE